MRVSRFGLLGALTVALTLPGLAGCQGKRDKLVHENFAQIRQELHTQADVARLLGDPDHELGNQWMYERPEKHLTAIIDFDNAGRVTRAQWIDATAPAWEDSDEADPNR